MSGAGAGLLPFTGHHAQRREAAQCESLALNSACTIIICEWPLMASPTLSTVQVMIDHDERKLRLIDWGLAEFYHPGKE